MEAGKKEKGIGAKIFTGRIVATVIAGFLALCVVSWVEEIFDLSHILFGAPPSRVNWREATFENLITVIVCALVLFVVLEIIATKNRIENKTIKLQRELYEKNKQLERINDLKNKFLGMAAHDLRNPISVMNMASKVISSSKSVQEDEKAMKYVGVVEAQSVMMKDLIDNFLDVSKVEAGKLDLNKVRSDYVAFVDDNIELNRFVAQKRGINVELKVLGDIPSICFDPRRMRQGLDNLLSNAIKYSRDNSAIEVEISSDAKNVTTKVIDHGVGIPDEDLNKIFKEFYVSTIKPKGSDTQIGLGLAITKKIVKAHGGKIGVKSTINEGSTFYFILPV